MPRGIERCIAIFLVVMFSASGVHIPQVSSSLQEVAATKDPFVLHGALCCDVRGGGLLFHCSTRGQPAIANFSLTNTN